jgi:hypothetical protein
MRSMSLLQMAGGVAVAGAVAAGSTAFTANGLTEHTNVSSGIIAGGSTNVTISEAAQLVTATLVQPAANPDRVTGLTATLTKLPGGAAVATADGTVKARFTGTGGDATSGAWVTCSESGGTWTCTIPASGYFTAVSAIDVSYLPA